MTRSPASRWARRWSVDLYARLLPGYHSSMSRAVPLLLALAVLAAGCAQQAAASSSKPTPCGQVVPGCHVKRLPNKTLHNGKTSGALGSVDGFDLSGTISFDAALRRAAHEDGIHNDARSVQVILGSADADSLHWGHGKRLYYAIDWSGVLNCPFGGAFVGPSPGPSGGAVGPSPDSCSKGHSGTVIDAKTGSFIVSGN